MEVREQIATQVSSCGGLSVPSLLRRSRTSRNYPAKLKRKVEVLHEENDKITKRVCEQKRRKKLGVLTDQIKMLVVPFMKEKKGRHRRTQIDVFKNAILHIHFHQSELSQTGLRELCRDLDLPTASDVLHLLPDWKEFSGEDRTRIVNKYREQHRRNILKRIDAELEKLCVPLHLQKCINRKHFLQFIVHMLKHLPCKSCAEKCSFPNLENETGFKTP